MKEMTFFEAALKVLREAAGGPLHFKEISKRAINAGYIKPLGRTPEASLGAQLYVHIKKQKLLAKNPRSIKSVRASLFYRKK